MTTRTPEAKPAVGAPDRPELPPVPPHQVDGRTVILDEPVRLGAEGRATAKVVRMLRECQAQALSVRWTLDAVEPPSWGSTAQDSSILRSLYHLPPPAPRPGEPPAVAGWREAYAYGRFFYRQGPDFLVIKDRRDPAASARFILDHPELRAAFHTCLNPTPLDALSGTRLEAVAMLADERIVLLADRWAVTLPPRIRHWPVPYTGI
ncbi:DUF5825 family protein [Streptomyces harbinensis]|uniref:DUF5825 family protein n=1 Tax=Streptomyces harbinensis TaxID=1176198 RepID=UPI0034E01EE2